MNVNSLNQVAGTDMRKQNELKRDKMTLNHQIKQKRLTK